MTSKAYEFDEIADGPFLPIYPVIAQQIIDETKISSGICLDIGSGGGHLGLSIAKITNMEIILLDKLQEALTIANNRAVKWGVEHKISTVLGNAQDIPLDSETINLCISRGSVWFWEDQKKGFEEIYRVLVYGGAAFIGGGFGSKELHEQVDIEMKKRDGEWPRSREKFVEGNNEEHFTKILNQAGIQNFKIIDDESGIWVVLKKI